MQQKHRVASMKTALLTKSREAALNAVQTFNNPLVHFKSETYIVLMVIAWTYLLHAYFRSQGIEYRYYDVRNGRRRFQRTKTGAYKYWELERCLNERWCPVDRDTVNNLHFLIGLRHEIEHQMCLGLDTHLSGRYQACSLNYNAYIQRLFGVKYGLDENLTYSIQFAELTREQVLPGKAEVSLPKRLKSYIVQFDGALTEAEYKQPSLLLSSAVHP